MRFRSAVALALAAANPTVLSYGDDHPLVVARSGIEQWVQTRQLVSRTKSDWEAEKEILLQTKALHERELAGIAEQLSKVSTNSTQVDRERVAAEQDLKASNDALDQARALVAALEGRVRTLTPRLPGPLLETMRPLLTKLPEDSQATKVPVTERVQTVVSLLSEVDKFNNAVAIYSEKRKNAQGEEVSVETVYAGLGAAWFVNQTGDFAGSGHPGANGWEWTMEPALAERVREVVRIYRGERTAHFVQLPVTLR